MMLSRPIKTRDTWKKLVKSMLGPDSSGIKAPSVLISQEIGAAPGCGDNGAA